jgi:hypothetical protein
MMLYFFVCLHGLLQKRIPNSKRHCVSDSPTHRAAQLALILADYEVRFPRDSQRPDSGELLVVFR